MSFNVRRIICVSGAIVINSSVIHNIRFCTLHILSFPNRWRLKPDTKNTNTKISIKLDKTDISS